MNVRLSKQFEFSSNCWWNDTLVTNVYDVTVSMISNTVDSDKHNVSVQRMEHFMKNVLGNAVMIRDDDTKQIERLQKAGIRTVEMPEEPFDQMVAIMLYCKLNAICAGHMLVTGIDLESKAGGNTNFMFDEDDGFGPFAEDGWWNDEEPTHQKKRKATRRGKVVKMPQPQWEWLWFGLEWEVTQDHGKVVKGDFRIKQTKE